MRKISGKTAWLATAAAILTTAACPLWALEVSLAPNPAAEAPGPARAASLTVKNDLDVTLSGAELAPLLGGPVVRVDMLIPPGSSGSAVAPLPAVAPSQTWRIELLDDQGGSAATTQTQIDWPLELVNPGAWIRPQDYIAYDAAPMPWPDLYRLRAMLLASLLAMGLGGTLLIRRVWLGLAVSVGLTAAALVVLALWLPAWPAISIEPTGLTTPGQREMLAIHARRTTRYLPDRPVVPIYFNIREFRSDDSLFADGRALAIPVKPGQYRLVQLLEK